MTRLVAVTALLFVAGLSAGCREEPTIVIKFEPNDMTGHLAASAAAAKPADLAAAPKPADMALAAVEKKKPPAKAECKTAADCVVEPVECCDCANGGKQHAIAKKLAAASKAARAEKCKAKMCTMMLSTDPSCGQRADCVDGACVMAAAKK
jgi:hypothetical protein